MRAFRSAVLGAVLLATAGATPAVAQAKFSLGGGLSLPLGDFGDATSTGWHGLGAVSFTPPNLPIGFQVDAMYNRFSFDNVPDDFDGNFRIFQGTANAVYTFQTSEDSKVHPYLIGGVGFYNGKASGDDVGDTESDTNFGLNGGAGFDFMAGAVGVFVEGRFHSVFSEGDNTNFIPITVGVRFGGAGS
jgi:Outer membrane protein beta-barrel domain